MEKILITGATGFIGSELVPLLVQQGYKVRILTRRPSRAALFEELPLESVITGDLLDAASLEKAVKDIDVIFHLGGRATFEPLRLIRPSLVHGSELLMQKAIEAGVKQFIYTSSLLVYGTSKKEINVSTSPQPQLDYGRAKLEAEQVLESLAKDSDIQLSCLRLPHIYGAKDILFSRLAEGINLLPGRGFNTYSHLHVEDTANILIEFMKKKMAGTHVFADDDPMTWRRFYSIIQKHFPQLKPVYLPESLALLGTYLMRLRYLVDRSPFMQSSGAVIGFNLNQIVSSNQTLYDQLGYKLKYPSAEQGIPASLNAKVVFRWIHPVKDRMAA